MIAQFFTIGFLMLFSSMLPGPDFALVTKNTIMYMRRVGIFTSLGIGSAILVHIAYCALGLALVISNSLLLFNIIKYIGAAYLIYLGVGSLLSKKSGPFVSQHKKLNETISVATAYRQGFLCNLLNPKATLFFLALFTVIIKPGTKPLWIVIYAAEMFFIITAWFITLTLILSHPRVVQLLENIEKYITKALGLFLIGFGVALAFISK